MRLRLRLILVPSAVALAACITTPTARVTAVPSGTGATAAPKPAGCPIPFLRAPPADRPFDELASLHYTTDVTAVGDPAAAQAAMREQACALGADAVLVTQEFQPGAHGRYPVMAGAALRFRSPAPPAATPAPTR